MKQGYRISLIYILLLVIITSCYKPPALKCDLKEGEAKLSIVPKPQKIVEKEGSFIISPETEIMVSAQNEEFIKAAEYFVEKFQSSMGFKININQNLDGDANKIILTDQQVIEKLGQEGYILEVSEKLVTIKANTGKGIFYGLQTVRQMLPPEIESSEYVSSVKWEIPCAYIEDRPRFEWRGMNFDCCRHFMDKEFVKRYIDFLSYYKMNRFHWHLTEDQGWRIEIKKYPELTEIGAWRIYSDGSVYGGFYTQDDVKEIVEYARERYVTVVPEIELPGHCQAALAAYPEYSCTGGPFEVSTTWGVHKDVYCAGNDETFHFLEDVLTVVMVLFPSKYIHIGGDEVPKTRWSECPKCQERIKQEGLNNEEELQSYFVKRINRFLIKHDRVLVGWDEILEGGLASGAIVQSWRGVDGGVAAAQAGHRVIMSPNSHLYFDASVERTDLRKTYLFEPIPKILNKTESNYIIGGECCMWTEHTPQDTIDSVMFPRLLAASEVFWSNPEGKRFLEFHKRLQNQYQRLELMRVKYGAESCPISLIPTFNPDECEISIALEAGESGLEIYYTLNGKKPTIKSKLYRGLIVINKTTTVMAQAFRNGLPYGDITEKKFIFHKAMGSEVVLENKYSYKYSGAGDLGLVDGIIGSIKFNDGCWQGYEEDDFAAVVDLGKMTHINEIKINFIQNVNSWIFLPEETNFYISNDCENFTQAGHFSHITLKDESEPYIKRYSVSIDKKTRYIKIIAKNVGKCPDWHPGSGGKAWIFVDEIIVE